MKSLILLVAPVCAVALVACDKKPSPPPVPSRSVRTTRTAAPSIPVKRNIHPGAFCSGVGTKGTREDGAWYVCRDAGDGRLRWMFDHR